MSKKKPVPAPKSVIDLARRVAITISAITQNALDLTPSQTADYLQALLKDVCEREATHATMHPECYPTGPDEP